MEINGIKCRLLENTGVIKMCEVCIFGTEYGVCGNYDASKICGIGDSYFVREEDVDSYFVREEDVDADDGQLTIPDVSHLLAFWHGIESTKNTIHGVLRLQ